MVFYLDIRLLWHLTYLSDRKPHRGVLIFVYWGRDTLVWDTQQLSWPWWLPLPHPAIIKLGRSKRPQKYTYINFWGYKLSCRQHYYRILWYCSDVFGCVSDLFQVAQSWKGGKGYRLTKRRNLTGQLLVPVGFRNPWWTTYQHQLSLDRLALITAKLHYTVFIKSSRKTLKHD